jgi:hypothetical protein
MIQTSNGSIKLFQRVLTSEALSKVIPVIGVKFQGWGRRRESPAIPISEKMMRNLFFI